LQALAEKRKSRSETNFLFFIGQLSFMIINVSLYITLHFQGNWKFLCLKIFLFLWGTHILVFSFPLFSALWNCASLRISLHSAIVLIPGPFTLREAAFIIMNFRSYEVYSHVRSYLNVVVFLNVRQSLPKYIRYCQGRVKRTDQQSICFFFHLTLVWIAGTYWRFLITCLFRIIKKNNSLLLSWIIDCLQYENTVKYSTQRRLYSPFS